MSNILKTYLDKFVEFGSYREFLIKLCYAIIYTDIDKIIVERKDIILHIFNWNFE